ncbi:Pls/PosA family non-ribosomal peptide synthetase [Streptomyces sp. NPDC006283]|uniref:Pls/PosA family non-ribosomal peptide synthetase n=1 Tax=Streptomyces sp. NPDC006283 TaxID=3156741 RepID=UPI0033AC2798
MAGKPVEALPMDLKEVTLSRVDVGAGSPSDTEQILTELLADVAGGSEIRPDSHFFDELGADSLVMAHFCAKVRKRADLPSVSMKDVYRHPTIRALATALADPTPAPPVEAHAPQASEPTAPTRRSHYVLCGVSQLLCFLGYAYLLAAVTVQGYEWISAAAGLFDAYLRAVVFGAVTLVVLCGLPILVKWVLIGRWKPVRFEVWGPAYIRFWIVKTLVRSNPLVLFVGSPLYSLYLKALGAKIGRGVTVFSRNLPVCTDLLTIGDDTVVRKDSFISCYQAHDRMIQTGSVTLGKNVYVSEATVIDIDTSLGDSSQLGHASTLYRGQAVPAGEHWHGSPAQQTDVDFRVAAPASCGLLRRTTHGVLQLVTVLLLYVPLVIGGVDVLLAAMPQLAVALEPGPTVLTSWVFYVDMLGVTAVWFFGGILAGLLVMGTVPRLLGKIVTPDRVHPLYGVAHAAHRVVVVLTNRRFMTRLFGDSVAIVHYLRWAGWNLSTFEQTGSNFGTMVKHETPYLSSVGRGTMVADGLSMMNAEYSSTSFLVSRTSIGAHNFLGNRIAYPSRGRTGDNCLLATKVAIPVDGEIREGVGLLGSPSFEIPRSVARDSTFDDLTSGDALRTLLRAKTRHNAGTIARFLLMGWFYFFVVTVLFSAAAELYGRLGVSAVALANVLVLLFSTLYFVFVERITTAFNPLGALFCSIYDRRFWRRERYWKVPSENYLRIFNGTPFKNVVWRLLGVRIGRMVFDDGCSITERAMATIGDECTLNAGSVVQCHSQEDGTFKSDFIAIGSGCTLGVGAFVHYGVTIGDGALLEADSFLMKGETVPDGARWGGNPARPLDQERGATGGGF